MCQGAQETGKSCKFFEPVHIGVTQAWFYFSIRGRDDILTIEFNFGK